MSHKKWIIFIVSIAAGVVGLSFLTLSEQLVYFYTPVEAVAQAQDLSQRDIRLGGMVESGSVEWDDQQLILKFKITDLNGTQIPVSFKGTPPDMFKDGQGVVAEGKISVKGDSFEARKLFVKHSEEYKQPNDPTRMDQEYIQKSMFKNQGADE